jgi:ATP-dependent DNA helicase PIF1
MRLAPGLQFWQDYVEKVGTGAMNNHLDQVEIRHVNITRDVDEMINFIYPDLCQTDANSVILATLNSTIDNLNSKIIDAAPGTPTLYYSIDHAISDDEEQNYPPEFLNTIEMGCLPPHQLKLKIGTPIVIIRNIQHPIMVNGTRATVTALLPNVIEARKHDGTVILIPRITIIPSDSNNTISFKRKQFPVKPCYAMTINRSQGQDFSKVGLHLIQPCFTHGQLCVALSRTPRPNDITVLLDGDTNYTSNPVYKECFT